MLTACKEAGRQKCARYWPENVGETATFQHRVPEIVTSASSRYSSPSIRWENGSQPDITVTFEESVPSSKQDEQHHRGWRTNTLILASGQSTRKIYQVEYLGWQDHGVPDSQAEVVKLLDHLNTLLGQNTAGGDSGPAPLVTHCSAGVGRTGSFIAIAWLQALLANLPTGDKSDIAHLYQHSQRSPIGPLPLISPHQSQSHLKSKRDGLLPSFLQRDGKRAAGSNGDLAKTSPEEDFDFVYATIDALRDQRTTMVQTPEQVEFVYQVVRQMWQTGVS